MRIVINWWMLNMALLNALIGVAADSMLNALVAVFILGLNVEEAPEESNGQD